MNAPHVNGDVKELVRAEMTRSDLSQKDVAEAAGISAARLSQWLAGKYPGDVQAIDDKMRGWLRSVSEQATAAHSLPKPPAWTITTTGKSILAALSYAHMAADMSVIYGGAGLGKTCTAKHYRETNPNVWMTTMTPSTVSVPACLERIGFALGVREPVQGAARLESEIIGRITGTGGLLIVDEAQHIGVTSLEAVRSLHDAAEIGVVLMGNERVYSQMTGGGARQAHFAQLFSRIGQRVRLNKPQQGDISPLLDAWDIPANARRLCAKIAEQHGALRYLTKTLRLAAMMAAGEGKKIDKNHVEAAWISLGGRS